MRTLNQSVEAAAKQAPFYMASTFLLSILMPIVIPVGSLILMPHRLVLLTFFLPCMFLLFSKRAGKIVAADWLILGSALWAGLAYVVNNGFAETIEPIGIHIVEFFGAYALARVAIRGPDDFRRLTKLLFCILIFLLPFAALESIAHRTLLLDLIPNSIAVVSAPERLGMRRAQVLFTHPIHYGLFASAGLAMFWFVLRPTRLRLVSVPATALATIFSLSTGALISFVVQTGFIAWETIMKSMRQRWRLFSVLAVIGYIAIDIVADSNPFEVLVNYASFNTGSAYNRILIWQFGTQNVVENPLFGLGLRDWVRGHWMSGSLDNFWLFIAVRFGLPAFLMFAAGFVMIIASAARADLKSDLAERCRAGFLASIGGMAIGGGTVHFWTAMMALFMFLLGSGVWSFTQGDRGDGSTEAVDADADPTPVSRYTRQKTRHTGRVRPATGVARLKGGRMSRRADV